jgi:hypothetical protein
MTLKKKNKVFVSLLVVGFVGIGIAAVGVNLNQSLPDWAQAMMIGGGGIIGGCALIGAKLITRIKITPE